MNVTVTGKQIDIGEALRGHVEERVRLVIDKYFDRPTDAAVTISKDAYLFTCDCMTHLSTGLSAQASAENSDVYAACDAAVAKLEKQLRRYKRKLKDHHKKRKEPVAQMEATSYLLRGEDELGTRNTATDADRVPKAQGDKDLWSPTIVAETSTSVPALSVGEAVMQLELSSAPFLLFWDDNSGRINLVYQRDDGHVGWIDPKARG
jgi:ribosomal subunit interface protein